MDRSANKIYLCTYAWGSQAAALGRRFKRFRMTENNFNNVSIAHQSCQL